MFVYTTSAKTLLVKKSLDNRHTCDDSIHIFWFEGVFRDMILYLIFEVFDQLQTDSFYFPKSFQMICQSFDFSHWVI